MANVEHSTLTGSDLHELKGVSTATNDTVATASGGVTVWQKLTTANFTGTGNAFAAPFHGRIDTASGGGSSSLTNNAWSARSMVTEMSDPNSIASIVGGQISLAAGGTYLIQCYATAYCLISGGTTGKNFNAKLRLRNITDGTTSLVGTNYRFSMDGSGGNWETNCVLTISGQLILGGAKLLELQQWSAAVGNGGPSINVAGGFPASSGENEVYADILIWKIA